MRGKITAAAGVLAVLLAWVGPGVGAREVFEDKFAALDPAWGLPSSVVTVKDGKLVVSPEINQSQTLLNQGFLFPNELEIRVSISFVKADDDTYGSGLVFWANDYWDYYALLVNAQGWFAVQRYVGGSYRLPVPWRESDVIKKGIAVDNLLRVATKDDQVTVYINGQELVTFQGQVPRKGGLIGMKTSSGPQGQDVTAFSDLQVLER
jgi:hypothetical protein